MNKISFNLLPFITLSFLTGIYAGELYPAGWPPVFLYGAAGVLALAAGFGVFFSKPLVSFKLTIGLFFIIGMVCWMHTAFSPADDIGRFAGGSATVEGIVDEVPQLKKIRTDTIQAGYLVKVTGLTGLAGNKSLSVPVSGRIRVNVYYQEKTAVQEKESVKINYGDKVSVFGEIAQIHEYNNPGRRNVAADMKRQGIGAAMNAKESGVKLLATGDRENSWRQRMADWQRSVLATMQKTMPDNDRGILSAIIFGKSEGISNIVLKNFSTAGLIHILCVSGAHIAIVAGFFNWLGVMLRLSPMLTGLCAMAGILLYAVISGLSPPVIRAAIMGAITIVAVILDRERDSLSALSVAALLMLAFAPELIYNIGFQLTFCSTAGIVFFYRPTQEYLSFLPGWIRTSFAVTIAAQLGCLPFMAWYFNNLSLISLLANLLVLPIIEVVLIIGLAGVSIHVFWPFAAGIVFAVCGLLIGAGVELTAFFAKTPGALLYLPTIGVFGGVVYYGLLFWVYDYKVGGMPGLTTLLKYFLTKKAGQAATVGLIAVFLLAMWYPKPLAVHFIDVGQGDCTLVATPGGKVILVDTGGVLNDNAAFDIGDRVVAPYLKHYGLRSIDYLILTHGHQDHAGGAAGIAANMTVDNIILAGEEHSSAVGNLLRAAPTATVVPAHTGQSFSLDGVWIGIEQAGESSNGLSSRSNEISSVIRINYGRHSFLLTGDLEAQGEAELIERRMPPATVLKLGHHGSRTSSTQEFLKAANPRYAVISAGYKNRFGHPHKEVLQRLAAQNIQTYRTDENGAIVFFTDGKDIRAESFK